MSAADALDWSVDNCSLGRAMAILGERWTVVVLREIFNGVRRFADIHDHAGVPRQVLTDRLARLVAAGILRRVPYQDAGTRTRHEYRLTPMGLELQPVLIAITRWGDRHLADPDGSPREFTHRDCGAPLQVELRCAHDHRVGDREVDSRPGPGARRRAG